jgi:hypothetical protein
MKRNLCLSVIAIMAGALSILPGCKKGHPGTDLSFCQIKQFSYAGSPLGVGRQENDTMRFTYNSNNDPVTGIRARPSTGYPNFFFRYDRQGRFTDLIGAYGHTALDGVESWTRYFYDNHNHIVRDSFYTFPAIVDGHPTLGEHSGFINSAYEYDSKDRIIKATRGLRSSTISYDQQGNIVGSAYDNKINLHRTNKIWMFIDHDYSVNNPATAAYTYNAFGLPTKIVPFPGTVMGFMSVAETGLEFSEADIDYDCH